MEIPNPRIFLLRLHRLSTISNSSVKAVAISSIAGSIGLHVGGVKQFDSIPGEGDDAAGFSIL
jgi:hypothetical protein